MSDVGNYTIPSVFEGTTMEAIQFTILVDEAPLNLTSATIKAVARPQANPAKFRQFETTIVNAASGIFRIDEQLIDWEKGTYNYAIQFTLSDGSVKVYVEGTFTIKVNPAHG